VFPDCNRIGALCGINRSQGREKHNNTDTCREEEKMSSEREATLEELLREPIIRQVMASYGVQADEIGRLFREMPMREPHRYQSLDRAKEAA
jgi:hypothetical protein